ncbi:unnamed protein product [Symbiodinium natans]|uniref:Uncharacterized protein n=1 Tax=Symbiodinium natans TaxID=878477 RepID=A0A812NL73_9DINO|nr:unnamed protein product [Symbiodinium natans]
MAMRATAVVFLSLCLAEAVRPAPKGLLGLEADDTKIEAPSHASFEEAKRDVVGALSSPEAGSFILEDPSALPACGLPNSGHHVLKTSMTFNDSCVWRGEEGLKVTLKAPLTFKGNLFLEGELRVEAAGPPRASCVTVLGTLSLHAARAVFVGCRNKAGHGGAVYVGKDFILSRSHLQIENCTAKKSPAPQLFRAPPSSGGPHCHAEAII